MVTMKGSSGVFGVLPGHVPTIAQLQPGVVTVEYDGETGTMVRLGFRPCDLLDAAATADCVAAGGHAPDLVHSASATESGPSLCFA